MAFTRSLSSSFLRFSVWRSVHVLVFFCVFVPNKLCDVMLRLCAILLSYVLSFLCVYFVPRIVGVTGMSFFALFVNLAILGRGKVQPLYSSKCRFMLSLLICVILSGENFTGFWKVTCVTFFCGNFEFFYRKFCLC